MSSLRLEDRGHGAGGDHGTGPRLAHEGEIVARPQEGVDQDRHRPAPDRPEKGVNILGTIGKDDQDPLLLLDVQPLERRGHLADALPELGAAHVDAFRLGAEAKG